MRERERRTGKVGKARFQAEECELCLAGSVQPLKVFGSLVSHPGLLGRLAWKSLKGEMKLRQLEAQ